MDIVMLAQGNWFTSWFLPILYFAIGLGLVIFVHELGHFLAAKWAGIKVEQFALGFGKRLFGVKVGDTDYRVNALPLGGYVKMLGQDDLRPDATSSEAGAWQTTSAGKRLVVLSAGVTMNVIFAAIVFVIVYMVGIRFIEPVIGVVSPDMPAGQVKLPDAVAKAMRVSEAIGLQPSDRVLAINGRPVRGFDEIFDAGALSKAGETVTFTIQRQVDGQPIVFDVPLQTKKIIDPIEGDRFGFGIGFPITNVIGVPAEDWYAGNETFKAGDVVIRVDKTPVQSGWQIRKAFKEARTGKVDVVVRRAGAEVTVPVLAYLLHINDDNLLSILGMAARVVVGEAPEDSPFKRGDVIVGYEDMGAPGKEEFDRRNKDRGGQNTAVKALRDGKQIELTIKPSKTAMTLLPEQDQAVVAAVAKDSPAAKAGIPVGARITKVNQTPVTTWLDVYLALKDNMDKDVTLGYQLGSEDRTADLGKITPGTFDTKKYDISAPALGGLEVQRTAVVRGNPVQALAWSATDTGRFITRTYSTLRGLFDRRLSPKGLRGPVGIAQVAVRIGQDDLVTLLYFMGMLSVIVAVINFLPLPVMDGGHVVLVLIEKAIGRPLPMKVQIGIQVVGIVLIIGLFVAVTFNDIWRIFRQ